MEVLTYIKRLFVSPSEVFAQQVEQANIKMGMKIGIIAMILSALSMFVLSDKWQELILYRENAVINWMTLTAMVVILTFSVMAFFTAAMHVCSKLFGGKGRYKSLFVCMLMAEVFAVVFNCSSDLLWGNIAYGWLDDLNQLEKLAEENFILEGYTWCYAGWMTYLYGIMIRNCYQFSMLKSILVVLLSYPLLMATQAILWEYTMFVK